MWFRDVVMAISILGIIIGQKLDGSSFRNHRNHSVCTMCVCVWTVAFVIVCACAVADSLVGGIGGGGQCLSARGRGGRFRWVVVLYSEVISSTQVVPL